MDNVFPHKVSEPTADHFEPEPSRGRTHAKGRGCFATMGTVPVVLLVLCFAFYLGSLHGRMIQTEADGKIIEAAAQAVEQADQNSRSLRNSVAPSDTPVAQVVETDL